MTYIRIGTDYCYIVIHHNGKGLQRSLNLKNWCPIFLWVVSCIKANYLKCCQLE